MEGNTNPELTDKTPTPTDYYSDKSRKKRDFWIGLIGSIGGNLVLAGLYFLIITRQPGLADSISGPTSLVFFVALVLPWILNIAAIAISLIKSRRYITLGILASYGAVLALSILAGIAMTIWCFVSGSNL